MLVSMFIFFTLYWENPKHKSLQCGPHKYVSDPKLPKVAGTNPLNRFKVTSLQIQTQNLLASQLSTIDTSLYFGMSAWSCVHRYPRPQTVTYTKRFSENCCAHIHLYIHVYPHQMMCMFGTEDVSLQPLIRWVIRHLDRKDEKTDRVVTWVRL